jgi:hypothetical protein
MSDSDRPGYPNAMCEPCKQGKFGICPPLPDREREPEDRINENWNCCTLCSGDKTNNIFYVNGQCQLDLLSWEQLYAVLRRYPNAIRDLERITSDPILLTMAREARLEVDPLDDDRIATQRINKNDKQPFYTVFGGNMDGSVGGTRIR